MGTRRGERGQAAVELALGLPLLAVLALALVQVGLVVRDQVLLTHAAREAAREAAVSADPEAIRAAALDGTRLDGDRLELDVQDRGRPGSRVQIVLRYAAPTAVPLVGALVGDVRITASVSMRVEM